MQASTLKTGLAIEPGWRSLVPLEAALLPAFAAGDNFAAICAVAAASRA